MASSSFRDSMNSLGWSRRNEQPANTSPQNPIMGTLSKLNPFGGEGYGIRLPTTEGEGPGAPLPAPNRRQEEEGWFARKSAAFSLCTHSSAAVVSRHELVSCFLDMFASCIRKPWGRMSIVCHKEHAARSRLEADHARAAKHCRLHQLHNCRLSP